MELSWHEQRVAPKADVIALCRPKFDDLWALGFAPRFLGARTALLHGREGTWDWAFAVKGRLDSIGTLGDGSVLAAGERLSVLFDGDRWSTVRSGVMGSRRIWGANPSRANALTDRGLFYFDGRNWARVDLEAQGIPGDWADGDCDSGGAGWIVGTHETHSCMASGAGTNWKEDGCGSFYLYRVCVAAGGRAFAAGGDGLWRYDGTQWIRMDDGGVLSPLPLAVSAAGPSPIVVAIQMRNLGRQTPELDILTAGGWKTVRTPMVFDVAHPAPIEVDTKGRLLMARGSTIWMSSPLTTSTPHQ